MKSNESGGATLMAVMQKPESEACHAYSRPVVPAEPPRLFVGTRGLRLLAVVSFLIVEVSVPALPSRNAGQRLLPVKGTSGLRAVVVAVRDMERSLLFYERQLGMTRVSDNWIEFARGNAMLLPANRKIRVVVLRHNGAGLADLRLVEIGGRRPDPIRNTDRSWDFGIFDLGFAAEQTRISQAQITAAGFFCKDVAQYHVPSDARLVIHESLCRGPDGEWVVIIQRPPPGYARGLAGITHSALSVRESRSVIGFYEEGLGLRLRGNTLYNQDGVRQIVGLPPGGRLRIITLQSEEDRATRLLLFEFSDGKGKRLLGRDLRERARPPRHGTYLLSFEVASLDSVLARCLQHGGILVAEPRFYESAPYGGARLATVQSPDGALYELLERQNTPIE